MSRHKQKKKRNPKQGGRPTKPKFALGQKDLIALGVVLLITMICFFPAFSADFVNWDDDYNIIKNENLKAFDWAHIKGIFSSHVIGNYNPLTILTFAIEKAVFGLNPFVFHLNNILLHLACTALVFFIFRRLKLGLLPAVAGALLFGIHPMRVESVAWITERKDVLFGFFSLWAILKYMHYLYSGTKEKKHFYIALALSALAMLAKIQAVAIPLSFLAIDYYMGRKLRMKLVLEKIPFFALSLFIGLIGIYFLGEQGSLEDQTNYNIFQRLIIGAHSYGVYLSKFIFPYRMVALYPYPKFLPGYFYISPVYVLSILALLYWAFKKDHKAVVFGILFFTFNVMFVLQVVGAGQGFLADRFTYLPYIGLIFILMYYWGRMLEKWPDLKNVIFGVMGAYLLLFAYMTFQQTGIWKNSGTLWTHTLRYYDNTPLPFRNRGNYFRDEGMIEKALADYGSAISLKSEDDGVYNSRAKLYFTQKNYQQALKDYNQAIDLIDIRKGKNLVDINQYNKAKGEYLINRGATKAGLGRYQDALADVTEGISLAPGMSSGYLNRSLLYSTLGQIDAAIQDIERYLTMEPRHAELWYEAGRLKRLKKRPQQALNDLNQAIRLNPNMGIFYLERSMAYFDLGNKGQAMQDANQARQLGTPIDPGYLQQLNN